VRHARPEDLDRIESLLERLRTIAGLRERKRGNFTRRSQAFLHFHEHDGAVIADVRFGADFERFDVTAAKDQRALIKRIEQAVGHES